MLNLLSHKLQHQQNWRTLSTLNTYRLFVAVAALGIRFSPWLQSLMPIDWPLLYALVAVAYFIVVLLANICTYWQRPRLQAQSFWFTLLDIGFICLLTFATSGVQGGTGGLLIVSIACACTLLAYDKVIILIVAAVAGLCLQEFVLAGIWPATTGPFWHLIVLCGLIIIAGTLSYWFALRLRHSALLLAKHRQSIEDLTALNSQIVEQLSTGVIAINKNQLIRSINAAAIRLLGLKNTYPRPNNALGLPLEQLEARLATRLKHWKQAQALAIEPVKVSDNIIAPYFRQIRTGANNSPMTLIYLNDINAQNAQAHQLKLAALGRMSASISHEIRNPLSALQQAVQLIEEALPEASQDDTDQQKTLIHYIHQNINRINDVITDVLSIAHRAKHVAPMLLLKPWLTRFVSEYQQQHTSNAKIILENIRSDQTLHFSTQDLTRVLTNLLENANLYGRTKNQSLTITIQSGLDHDRNFYLEVSDNGPGFKTKSFEKLLEPFYTTRAQGTGLGLYISRELCVANNADLRPIQKPDGACFRMVFGANMGAI